MQLTLSTNATSSRIHSQLGTAELADFLSGLTATSRPIIDQWFRAAPDIDIKADASPVTVADRAVETALRAAIMGQFPGDDIIGEEHADSHGDGSTGYQWVIDPIDGTKAFICGKPEFGTLVGLIDKGRPVAGLVDMPALRETYVGIGTRCLRNGDPVVVSDCTTLSNARLATTSPDAFSGVGAAAFDRVKVQAGITSYGGDCYNYALLASGHIDLVIEDSLASHDIMGPVAVVMAAGGVVTDLTGAPVLLCKTTSLIAAATPSLHAAVLALVTS